MSSRKPSRFHPALTALSLCLTLALPLEAQSAGSADPLSLWDHLDNPAATAFFPDSSGIGVRAFMSEFSLSLEDNPGIDVALLSPCFAYRYRNSGIAQEHLLSSAASYQNMVSLGTRLRWDGTDASGLRWGMGLMLRPANYLSLALSVEDTSPPEGETETDIVAGLALRPLAFNRDLERLLTLSLDARWDDRSTPDIAAGARFLFNDWVSLQGMWDFASQNLRAGLWVNIGGLETAMGASPTSLYSSPASLSQSVRIGRSSKSVDRIFKKRLLVLDELVTWLATPPSFDSDPGTGNQVPLWFDLALAAIERAANDNGIAGMIIYRIPHFDSDARALEFSRVLSRFKEAGKPIYVHAISLDRREFLFTAAAADYLALDPNGFLPANELSYVNLYFKGLLEKYGIDTYSLQSHETKTANNIFTERGMTEAERAMMQRWLNGMASSAADRLELLRGDKLASPAASIMGQGPWLDPRSAVETGLIDTLQYRDEFDKELETRAKGSARVDLRAYAREKALSWGKAPGKRVAIVHLKGNIIEAEGEAGSSIGTRAVKLLEAMKDDKSLAGVILRVDSGGGSALTSDHLARAVKQLREEGKKVVVSMAGYAASGGYYLSANADRIVAEENTITGSIGVTGFNINISRLLDKLDLGVGAVSAGDSPIFGNALLPHREGDDARYREMIMYVYDRFVDTVAEGRKLDRAKVDEIGKGQVWLGKEALANGLVDELGGLAEAKAAMEKLLEARANYENHVPGTVSFWAFLPAPLRGAIEAKSPIALPAALERSLKTVKDLEALGSGPLCLEAAYLEGLVE